MAISVNNQLQQAVSWQVVAVNQAQSTATRGMMGSGGGMMGSSAAAAGVVVSISSDARNALTNGVVDTTAKTSKTGGK
ncbi:MAG: hypothetical protein HQL05_03340 [Nitrospirae bacterium]|uniref:hypothetical protein n=1 Tax=Candidatus Magnetobacterium casense TaxID=1455061 RepID=UPI0005914AF4|nr:hypothetical protein [Candidatus Magnetobacterium casensis]MBF0336843.1 hypothetical protein [Nitrospirota bacterium]